MLLNFKRIIKFSWQGIRRNKGLGLQVVFIISIAVFVWTALFFSKQVGVRLIEDVEKKVDISVYFKEDTQEKDIFEVKDELSALANQIKSVNYISNSEALNIFKQRHENDSLYLRALEEVEDNPFLASLNIKAFNPSQYAEISAFLEQASFSGLIETISYNKNKQVIDKIFAITNNIKVIGIGLGSLLILLVILITFNIIKLNILTAKEEISTMRLVGASNWFIRGPFLAQGIFYALFAVIAVDVIFLIGLSFFSIQLSNWFLGVDFFKYFKENALLVIPAQVLAACMLGIFSTFLAIRKHLKV